MEDNRVRLGLLGAVERQFAGSTDGLATQIRVTRVLWKGIILLPVVDQLRIMCNILVIVSTFVVFQAEASMLPVGNVWRRNFRPLLCLFQN